MEVTIIILMGTISALEAWAIFIFYFLIVLLSIFVVVKQKEYSSFVKVFLGLLFLFIPFAGLIYLLINFRKIPALVN